MYGKNFDLNLPLNEKWLKNKKVNDVFFSYLMCNSFKSKEYGVRLVKASLVSNASQVAKELTEKTEESFNRQQITTQITRLKKLGLMELFPQDNKYYWFPLNEFVEFVAEDDQYLKQAISKSDKEKMKARRYCEIDSDTLTYLYSAFSVNTVKTYVFLLSQFKYWKVRGEQYKFTVTDVCKALGYEKSAQNLKLVRDVLDALHRTKFIVSTGDFMRSNSKDHYWKCYKLVFVNDYKTSSRYFEEESIDEIISFFSESANDDDGLW